VSVCVGVLCVFTKNIAQKPVEGRETVEEAFSCTPLEIVSAAKNQNTHFQSMNYFSKTVIIVLLMSIL
jgi:hypothetical protein